MEIRREVRTQSREGERERERAQQSISSSGNNHYPYEESNFKITRVTIEFGFQ